MISCSPHYPNQEALRPAILLFTLCILIPGLFSGTACAIEGRPGDARLLYVFDFERGTLSGWHKYKLPSEDSAMVVTSPVRSGKYAVQFQLRRPDRIVAKGKRAELQMFRTAELGHSYWYGLSIFIPEDWVEDYKDEVVAQWNATADRGLRENEKRSPPLALRIRGREWLITQRYDPRPLTPPGNGAPKRTLWKGPYEKGRWTDWVVQAHWDYDEDGRLEIWRNGQSVVRQEGPNAYNDKKGLRFKVGIYKPQWNDPTSSSAATVRRIFHDEVRIGGADASYDLVKP